MKGMDSRTVWRVTEKKEMFLYKISYLAILKIVYMKFDSKKYRLGDAVYE